MHKRAAFGSRRKQQNEHMVGQGKAYTQMFTFYKLLGQDIDRGATWWCSG